MSFGLLKHFKDLKKNSAEPVKAAHVRHIIIGQDLGAVLKLIELKKNAPEENVKLISSRPINKQLLIENYQFGISQLRSEEAVREIYTKRFDAKILPHNKDSLFYKDGKFHEFGGRAKSMEILNGEEFFVTKGYTVELSSLFAPEVWENLDQIISSAIDIRIFESIEKTDPQDLVEKNEWLLTFKDYQKMTCENLYISMSPKKFVNLLTNKEQLTPELIDFCTAVQVRTGLSVTWSLNKEIYPEERTLFIPQSMTHEWGHFIVEFENYNHSKKEQLCHVLFLIHEEEPQTEDLASKIKLMKRVLERVFPELEKSIAKEYIRFDEEMFVSDIKDNLLEQLGFDYPTLKFVGQVAPVSSSFSNEKYLSRVLLS